MIMKQKRKFDKAFKLEVVKRSLEDQITLRELGEELDIHPGQISNWRKAYLDRGEREVFVGKGNSNLSEQEQEIKRLKQELSDAKLEAEILKKAIRIFSKSDRKSTNS